MEWASMFWAIFTARKSILFKSKSKNTPPYSKSLHHMVLPIYDAPHVKLGNQTYHRRIGTVTVPIVFSSSKLLNNNHEAIVQFKSWILVILYYWVFHY